MHKITKKAVQNCKRRDKMSAFAETKDMFNELHNLKDIGMEMKEI